MAFEKVQEGFSSNDHGIVLWIPGEDGVADLDAPTVAELTGPEVVRLTYGLTPDGFQLENTQNKIQTGRYTLGQELTLDGTVSDALTLLYVYNRENPTEVEQVLGQTGAAGTIVHALGYVNDHEFEPGDVINELIPVRLSQSVTVPPAVNTEPTKRQVPNVTGRVAREAVVAGP